MLKEAIEKIATMATPNLEKVENRTFMIGPNGAEELRPELDRIVTITLNSLDALTKMVKKELNTCYGGPLFIQIPSHLKVIAFTMPNSHERCLRLMPYEVKATDVPGWEPETLLGFEQAMIALRARFQETEDTTYALKLLSDITTGSKVTYNDNGIATSVVTQSGVALQKNANIRPIIRLRPYRTFQEVEQPESRFLIRVTERGIKFVEADGGMWKLTARQTIKEYLEKALEHEVREGTVVIAL